MNEKQKNIIETAIDVFSRYGVRRTTMGDIAEAVGVSRQTLYGSYSNKDDLFAAAAAHVSDVTLSAIEEDWRNCETLGEKLDAYFQHAVVAYYDMVQQMPDAADLQNGYNEAGRAALDTAYERKRRALETILEPFSEALARRGTGPKDLSDFIQSTSTNFKFSARDKHHLNSLLSSLKRAVLAMADEI